MKLRISLTLALAIFVSTKALDSKEEEFDSIFFKKPPSFSDRKNLDSIIKPRIVYPQGPFDLDSIDKLDEKELNKKRKLALEKRDSDSSKVFEILGKNVVSHSDYMLVEGQALLKHREGYVLADRIYYYPGRKQVRAIGNVRVYRGNQLSLYAKQANFYLNTNLSIIKPFYIQENSTGIWTNADSASHHKNVYRFAKSMVSSCSYVSPAWRIVASRGHYNQESNMLALWHPRIYIGDIPIFYSPYLRFSLENDRTSGLLYPTVGSSSTDGIVYIQPIYLAFQSFWDITLSPQIRTSRGYGVNFQFRAVDSSSDKYVLGVRYFYNNNEYVKKLDLLNQHIYGFDFRHSKRNVVQKYFGLNTKLDNAMYFDIVHMNDLDYMRLDSLRYAINSSFYTSRANLYAQTDSHYFGINLRYYLSLNNVNNYTTFQNLPNLQYHKYLDTLIRDEIMYSIDYKLKNASRTIGYSYLSNEISVPIGVQISLLNKYISLGAWLRAYAGNIYAYNTSGTGIYTAENKLEPMQQSFGNYINLNYKISLNSDIGRRYKNFFHSMQSSIVFYSPIDAAFFSNGIVSKNILNTFDSLGHEVKDAIQNGQNVWDPTYFNNLYDLRTRMELNISNYFYNNKGRELFYWRMNQIINFSDKQSFFKLPMENKIGTSPIDGLYLNFSFFYSWFYNGFTELALSATYSKERYAASISYYLKRDDAEWSIDPNTLSYRPIDSSNYLSVSLRGDLGYFGVVGNMSYDFKSNILVNLGIGVYKDIRCFGIGIKAGTERTPILIQNNQINVINNIYAKVEFKFVPITKFGYTYRLQPFVEGDKQNSHDKPIY